MPESQYKSLFELLELPLAQAGQQQPTSIVPTIVMMVGIFVIFYFLMIRPQQKKQKELKAKIEAMDKGDTFITAGGLYATVVGIKEHIVTAKISDDVKVDIAKASISVVLDKTNK